MKKPSPLFHLEYHIVTLFPDFFTSPLSVSLVGKGFKEELLEAHFYDIRDYGIGRHKQVDDRPFGGGAGMILRPEPLWKALTDAKKKAPRGSPVIYFTPRGQKLTQKKVQRFSQYEGLIMLCGRYEGVDQRVIDQFVTHEVSMGEYVLAGGETAALALIEATARFMPGVLGNFDSTQEESFSDRLDGKKEYPLYTQPREFKGLKAPDVLFSGNHKAIEKWKRENCK